MRRPTYDIEYLIDYASDYGTHASMSSAIDHVIDYIEYLEAKITGIVKVNPADTCPKCGGMFIWKMEGGGFCTLCKHEEISF